MDLKPIPPERQALFAEVIARERIVCLHALCQPLVDHLVEIIKIQAHNIDELDDELAQVTAEYADYQLKWPDIL